MEPGKGGRQVIVVDEIPYTVKKKALVTQIEEEILEKNVDGLMEVRDETDREGLRIVLELRKDADPAGILNYLFKKTDLQISYSFNMLVIADARPQQMGLKGILEAYISHQKEIITRRTQHDLDRAEKRLHVVEGIIRAISILREVIDTIMNSDGREDARNRLMAQYEFTYEQAEAILEIRLHQLTRLDIKKYEKEQNELEKKIATWRGILNSEKKLNHVLEKELTEIRDRYGNERRTVLEDEIENLEVDISITVPAEETIVTLSEEQYIKRTSMRSFNSSGASIETSGVKEGDHIRYFIKTNTIHQLLIFTENGDYFFLPVHEIPDSRWKDHGTSVVNVLSLGKDQKIVAVIPIESFDDIKDSSFLFVTKKGMVKRSKVEEYRTNQKKRGIAAVKVKENDGVLFVHLCKDEENLLLLSNQGNSIRFTFDEVQMTGRNTAGVRGMKLEDEDEVGYSFPLHEEDGRLIQLITKEGVVKRTAVNQISNQGRGGKGSPLIRRRKVQPHQIIMAFIEQDFQYRLIGLTTQEQEVMLDWMKFSSELTVNDPGSIGRNQLNLTFGEELKKIRLEPRIEV